MDPIIILGAMQEELRLFLENIKDPKLVNWHEFSFYEGTLGELQVILSTSGVGKCLSALISQHLIDRYSPSHVIFTGLAGALSADLKIGDVLVARDLVQHDLDVQILGFKRGQIPFTEICEIPTSPFLNALALKYHANGFKIVEGRILSGDQFITSKHRKLFAYLESLNGDAIEMEGASIGLVCKINNIPSLIIRTISDQANENSHNDFPSFLPIASERSFCIIMHVLEELRKQL